MFSQQIQTLLAPPKVEESNERTLLFLQSRFQSLPDLGHFDSVVLEAQQCNDTLQSNLSHSRSEIGSLLEKTRSSAETHLHTAQELSLLRHSLTDELHDLSQGLVSEMSDEGGGSTLLEDIETLHRNLRELQSVKGYVQIIEHALKLSESSVQQIRSAGSNISSTSLSQYQALQDFVDKVSGACSSVEDGSGKQTLHLIEFLEGIRDKSWAAIKDSLSGSLSTIAEKIGWPNPVDYLSVSPEDRKAFESAFLDLLRLQNMGNKIRVPIASKHSEKNGLYPLQTLVHPISLRFKYHFEGSRQTNRLDKPEWYFTHILNVAHEHRLFMDSIIQKLLFSSECGNIIAWREFTFLLFPMLSRKLKHTIPSLLPHPSLLAHTIYQTLVFDAALLEEGFQIQQTSEAKHDDEGDKWEGISEVILGNLEWFEIWLSGEKKFAEDQYHEVISAADAWTVSDDDDGYDDNSRYRDLKSTNSARRIRALVEQITDRYLPLPHFSQQTRFLLSVQLPILDSYCGRITASLDAFETLSSAFVRAVPGALSVSLGGKEEGGVHVDTRGLTSGVEGVQRLCKALLSAKYIEASIWSWGEELFFLELWTEILRKPTLRARAMSNLMLPDLTTDGDNPSGTIFDKMASRYQKLVQRAEDMVVEQVCGEIESVAKAHFTTSQNTNRGQIDSIALPHTLLAPITLLSSHLNFLRTTLPQTVITSLYRRIAARLAEHILQRQILYRGHFDIEEAKETLIECELWVQTCHEALGGSLGGGRARVDAPWAKLLQAGRLTSAEGDIWTTITGVTFGPQAEDEWETAIAQAVGSVEMSREEVATALKRREDCS